MTFKKENKISDIANAEKFLGELYIHIGSFNKDKGRDIAEENFNTAYTTLNKSLKFFEFIGDLYAKGDLYNILGVLYYENSKICSNECNNENTICKELKLCTKINILDKAKEELKNALYIRQKMKFKSGEADNFKDLGLVHLEYAIIGSDRANNIEMAQDYCDESLKIYKDIGDRYGEGEALRCIGLIHKEKAARNKTNPEEEYKESLDNLEESREIFEDIEAKAGLARVLKNIRTIYQEEGKNTDKIVKKLEKVEEKIKDCEPLKNDNLPTTLEQIKTILEKISNKVEW